MQNTIDDNQFAVAIALTHDHALMACGFLAKLRHFHPGCDLFIITDKPSLQTATEIAKGFDAKEPIVTDKMGFDCLEWGAIVTSKFRVFDLPTDKPVMFLDIDQILAKPVTSFVEKYLKSDAIIAGGADDEPLGNQFKGGQTPAGLDPNANLVINTGAFVTIPDPEIFQMIKRAIPEFSGSTRLPTQGLINGLLYQNDLRFDVYGDDFMIGPFNKRVLDKPSSATLIHLWTPRPPFMFPNPQRTGVDGNLTWKQCVIEFEETHKEKYPYAYLRNEYMNQMRVFEEKFSRLVPNIERPQGHLNHYHKFLSAASNSQSSKLTFD
ncbi:MAG: hypothetical protein CL570_00335 [Alphaproteobacteria bacterium]|nr:hypothetical protein [Alphaproteobacteria bacterium]|tara:strand:- start:9262 stop:10227 length:966 start_codon:yes stop_codon:yes gene_type:complete